MNTFRFFTALVAMLVSLNSRTIAQHQPDSLHPSIPQFRSEVVTGDTIGGIKYYIKIVPGDTTNAARMPIYKPEEKESHNTFQSVNRPPALVRRVEPKYPEEARRNGIEGTVWVNCLIEKNGSVAKTKVIRADNALFVEPSIAAVHQWRFESALLDGNPVAVWASIPIHFRLGK